MPLTGAQLLRNFRVYHEEGPWLALLLAALPLGAAYWLFRKAPRLKNTTVPVRLAQLAAGLTAALSLAMMVLVLAPSVTIHVWTVPASAVGIFVVLAAATVRMVNDRAAAIFVDQQVGLSERVSTALEILNSPAPVSSLEAAFNAPVIASALKACQEVKTARVGYSRLGSRTYALAAVAATAAICVSLLPPVAAQARAVRGPTIAVVKTTKDLQQVFKELEEKKLPNDKITAERLKPLQTAIQQLQQGNMSQIEANSVLNEAKEQMKRDQEALAASDKVQEMLRQMSQTQDFSKAADDMKEAQMRQTAGDANAANQQKNADDALKNSANSLADKVKNGTDAEKKDIADKLQAAADKAKSDPQLQKDLQSAADAARKGDASQMSQSMQDAGQHMGEQQANEQASQDSVNRAMSEINRMQGSGTESTLGSGTPPGMDTSMGQQNGAGNNGQGQDQANGNQNQGGNQSGSQGSQGQGNSGAGQQASAGGNGGDGKTGQNSDAGGSTNFENKGSAGPSNDKGPIGGTGSFVRIYDQRVNQSNGTQEKVGSFINPLGKANGSTDVMGAADKSDPSIKTYEDVLPEARQRAMEEMSRQEYPPQYQEMVKQFYQEDPKGK